MRTLHVDRFDGGMGNSRYDRSEAKFTISKHFDIFLDPYRLIPFRGMAADTSSTGIGNVITGSDGNFYGIGGDPANGAPANGAIWTRASGSWVQLTHTSGTAVSYNLLVEYHNAAGTRHLFYASTNTIKYLDFADTALQSHALTHSNICQGYVHPKDDILYIGYDNKIAKNDNNTWTDAALTLPANYRVTSLTSYGNYLAIACTPSVNGTDYGGGGNNSVVFLWNRDDTTTTVDESIDWGTGNLKVLNNLDGILIGISDSGGASSNVLDYDSIQIKAFEGGVPVLIKEIPTQKQTTTAPDAVINPRVRFVYRGRLYFSINIDSGSTSPAYRGLWAISRSKVTGQYAVTLERVANVANTETAVLAAAIAGDKVSMVYNAEGTLSFTNTTASIGDQWTATSVYESVINPKMPDGEYAALKQLGGVYCRFFLPVTGAQIVVKYRVDSAAAWTTIFTKAFTTPDTSTVFYETTEPASGQFTSGYNYEFRIESTGGAEVMGFGYRYHTLHTNV